MKKFSFLIRHHLGAVTPDINFPFSFNSYIFYYKVFPPSSISFPAYVPNDSPTLLNIPPNIFEKNDLTFYHAVNFGASSGYDNATDYLKFDIDGFITEFLLYYIFYTKKN